MVVDEIKMRGDGKSHDQKPAFVRWFMILALGYSMVSSTGCTAWTGAQSSWQYNHYWNESIMVYRHKSMANKAWHSRKHAFVDQKYLFDFARGFKAGYRDVASGADGCTPAFPPREYWGWKYQSCEGQARVAAWFSGYPYGAQAAEQDGIGNWSQIQTSKGIQNTYANHGLMPTEYNGMYPVPNLDPDFRARKILENMPQAEVIESNVIEQDTEMASPLQFETPEVPAVDPRIQ
jgi:hypothetical protein